MSKFLFSVLTLVFAVFFGGPSSAFAQDEDALIGGEPKSEQPMLPAALTSPTEVKPEPKNTTSQSAWYGAHMSVGFPAVAQVGLDFLNASESFGASIRGGNIQRGIDRVDASMKNLELQLRYHPWSTAFYYGVAIGQRSANIEKTDTVSGQSVKAVVEGSSDYVTPQIGWVWIFNNGLNIGFELGYLLPFNNKVDFSTTADASLMNQNAYRNLESDVRDQGDYLTKLALPHFTLIRLGWSY